MVPSHTSGPQREAAGDRPAGHAHRGGDDGRRRQGGEHEPTPVVERRGADQGVGQREGAGQAGQAEQDKAPPGDQGPGHRGHPLGAPAHLDDGHGAGQHRADQDGLGMGVGAEVEPGGVGHRAVEQGHLQGRGQRAQHRQRQQDPDAAGEGAREVHHRQHHQRPDQVELLLDGQGPGVGEGRGRRRWPRSSCCWRRSATSWRSRRGRTGRSSGSRGRGRPARRSGPSGSPPPAPPARRAAAGGPGAARRPRA